MRRSALAGLLAGSLLMLAVLLGNDGDPATLLAIGEDSPSRAYTEELMGREVPLRPSVGHDGRFFFAQAVDPLYLGDTSNARYLDLELYRGQRMLFPVLIGLAGAAPAPAIPWLMMLVNTLAYGLGTAATSRIARQQGASSWWGLAFPLNASLIMAFLIGGAGVLALALALAGTAAIGERRVRTAAILFALSVLTRETMILYVAGVVLFDWWQTRRIPWTLGAIPALSYAGWYGYILLRLDHEAIFETNGGLGVPFNGFLSAARTWGDDPASIVTAALTITICALIVHHFLRAPTHLLAGTVGFVVLAALLARPVWLNSFDISRAVAPIYTTFVIAAFAKAPTDESVMHSAEAGSPEPQPI